MLSRILRALGSPWDLDENLTAWALYDTAFWGYNGMALQTLTPILFHRVVHHYTSMPSPELWGYVFAAGVVLNVICAPVFGAIVDGTPRKMTVLGSITAVFACAVVLIPFFANSNLPLMVVCVVISSSLAGSAVSAYNSILQCIAPPEKTRSAFAAGTSYANFGAGLLLVLLALVSGHGDLSTGGMQIVFLLGVVWLLIFSFPLLFTVPQDALPIREAGEASALSQVSSNVKDGLKYMGRNPEMLHFAIGAMVVTSGTSCLDHISLVFGAFLGISNRNLFIGTIFNRFVGSAACHLWQVVGAKSGSKSAYLASAMCYLAAGCITLVMTKPVHFFVQSSLLGAAGSGMFIYYRELLTKLTSMEYSAHTFSVVSSVTGVGGAVGPSLYSILSQMDTSPRAGFILPVLLILIGSWTVSRVDFVKGKQISESEAV